jgi:N-acyl amino acid synthase of PEP-CTERM/exosortase system
MAESPIGLFEYIKVPKGDPLLNEIYRLRYKVYCEEWGFEKPEEHPGGIEKDEFDEHSVHFVVRKRGEEQIIGTIRMINNSERGFLIEKHCKMDLDLSTSDKNSYGELSRLAVSKDFRKRITDNIIFDGKIADDSSIDTMYSGRRKMENDIVLGLYKCIYKECHESGRKYLLALMAKGLFLLLKRVGILFEPVGQAQNYHGLRTPYRGRVDTMLQALAQTNPSLYEEFMR